MVAKGNRAEKGLSPYENTVGGLRPASIWFRGWGDSGQPPSRSMYRCTVWDSSGFWTYLALGGGQPALELVLGAWAQRRVPSSARQRAVNPAWTH